MELIISPDRDFIQEPLQVFSFGGGVQSTAMLHLIADGLLERPDIAIFADTGSELPETLEHIEKNVIPYCERIGLPFEIVKSPRGNLHDDYLKNKAIPMVGIRSCTVVFKIFPQRRRVREIVGKKNGVLIAQAWLGITTDEAKRRTESDVKWMGIRYPLLDDLPMSRDDCIKINEDRGFQPVKSGCFCCPYAGKKTYMDLKTKHPDLFDLAIKMEDTAMKHLISKGKTLRTGLCSGSALSNLKGQTTLTDLIGVEDSECDSGWNCFI